MIEKAINKNNMDLLNIALLTQVIIMIPSIIIIVLFLSSNDYVSLVAHPLLYPSNLKFIYLGSLGLGVIMSFFLILSPKLYYNDFQCTIIVVIGLVGMVLCSSMALFGMVSA